MIPPIFATLSANAGVNAIIGAGDNCRCYPFGFAKQGTTIPYVTWFKVSGQPLNKLFKGSFTDKIRAQVDCWGADGASALALARAVRASLETSGCMIGLNFTERDAETRLYRYSMDFEFIVNRGTASVITPNNYTLLADSIAYALTCSDAGLYFGRRLVADSASYALTLTDATLTYYIPPFDPASLFTGGYLGGWYDPSDISTLWQDSARTIPVTADGDPVGAIDDKSGNGMHLIQTTSGKRPLYKTSGGLHWLEFDGIDDALLSANVNLSAFQQVYYSFGARSSVAAARILFEFGTSFNAQGSFYNARQNGLAEFNMGGSPSGPQFNGPYYTNALLNTSTDAVTSNQLDRNQTTYSLEHSAGVNGTIVTPTGYSNGVTETGSGTFGTYPFSLGSRSGTSVYFGGRIYSGIIVVKTLSGTERTDFETWQKGKSGL